MKSWKRAMKDAVIVGTTAGLTSLSVLVVGGRKEQGSPWGPINAPSHWVWGDRALRKDGAIPRYTATGFAIHQLASGFWAVLHERFLGHTDRVKVPAVLLRDALITTTVAAVVDLVLVPHRLTPGFQERLSKTSLLGVYSLFGFGLALGSYLVNRPRER